MRTFFSYFIGVVITFLAITFVPIERLFDEIMNTQKVVENVKSANLYANLSRLTAQKVIGQKQLGLLKNTPLMPTQEEVQEVIQKTFTEEWFLNNISATHTNMIYFMTDPVSNRDRFVGVILADRKNLLTENLTNLIEFKMDALPQCTPQELVKMSMSYHSVRKGLNIDISKFNITCRPPAEVQKLLVRSIREQLDKVVNELPDSLNWLHNTNSKANQSGTLVTLGSLYRFTQSFTLVGYGVLFFFLLLIAFINFGNLPALLYRLGFPFILTGILLPLPFAFIIAKSNDLFTMSSMRLASGDDSMDPLSNDAFQLIVSFIKTLSEHYSWTMIYFAVVLFIIGIGLVIGSRILKIKPLSPLDKRHETNI